MNNNIQKVKNMITIVTLILIIGFAFYVSKHAKNEELVEEKQEEIIEETIERIDISDVEDKNIREMLLRIDDVNQTLGKDIAITKEEFLKYRGTKIGLIGDSIADCSKSSLIKYFSNINIDAVPGREINTVVSVFNNMRKYKKLGDIVVVSLGTNALNGITIDLLEKVYGELEGRPMVMFSVVLPYNGQERNRNRDIKKFLSSHDNCYLVDWNKLVKKHQEYFVEDKIHPNGAGGEVYAQALFKTIIEVVKDLEKK